MDFTKAYEFVKELRPGDHITLSNGEIVVVCENRDKDNTPWGVNINTGKLIWHWSACAEEGDTEELYKPMQKP